MCHCSFYLKLILCDLQNSESYMRHNFTLRLLLRHKTQLRITVYRIPYLSEIVISIFSREIILVLLDPIILPFTPDNKGVELQLVNNRNLF